MCLRLERLTIALQLRNILDIARYDYEHSNRQMTAQGTQFCDAVGQFGSEVTVCDKHGELLAFLGG